MQVSVLGPAYLSSSRAVEDCMTDRLLLLSPMRKLQRETWKVDRRSSWRMWDTGLLHAELG